MSDAITVRLARTDDVAAIAEAHVDGWRWGYRGQLPDAQLDALDARSREALWSQVLGGEFPDADVFVAERDGRVVGFAAAGPTRDDEGAEDEGEIYALYVLAAEAGRGTGTALLTATVAALRERGAGSAVLWVLAGNARARRFFERERFVDDGAARDAPWEGLALREVRYRLAVGG